MKNKLRNYLNEETIENKIQRINNLTLSYRKSVEPLIKDVLKGIEISKYKTADKFHTALIDLSNALKDLTKIEL